jgi:hypothetical protein
MRTGPWTGRAGTHFANLLQRELSAYSRLPSKKSGDEPDFLLGRGDRT